MFDLDALAQADARLADLEARERPSTPAARQPRAEAARPAAAGCPHLAFLAEGSRA